MKDNIKAINKTSLLKFIATSLRNSDIYGHPINLTYNDSPTYKTILGGIWTLITRCGIFAYFVVQILGVINHQSAIRTSQQLIDTTLDPTVYTIEQSKFDFAINLQYALNYSFPESLDLHQYVYVGVSTVTYYYLSNGSSAYDYTNFVLEVCKEGRFNNDKYITNSLGIFNGSYYCIPDNTTFDLYGSFSSLRD